MEKDREEFEKRAEERAQTQLKIEQAANDDLIRTIDSLREENALLKAEVDALRQHAEMYRWVRENLCSLDQILTRDDEKSKGYYQRYCTPEEIDAEVIKAMKEAK